MCRIQQPRHVEKAQSLEIEIGRPGPCVVRLRGRVNRHRRRQIRPRLAHRGVFAGDEQAVEALLARRVADLRQPRRVARQSPLPGDLIAVHLPLARKRLGTAFRRDTRADDEPDPAHAFRLRIARDFARLGFE